MTNKIAAWSPQEGVMKVASLTLIGRGAAFSFRKEEDNFVIVLEDDKHIDVFPPAVRLVREGVVQSGAA